MQKAMVLRDNPMYEGAVKALDSWKDRIKSGLSLTHDGVKNIRFKRHVWFFMYENDPHSPKIMQLDDGMEEVKRFFIYYPENSTPYKEDLVDSFKIARILSGEIWDQIENKLYTKDDVLCVKPGDRFLPKTTDKDCHVLVEVGKEMIKNDQSFIYRNCGDI